MDVSNQQVADRLNEELRKRYTEISQLAGGLAHEIRNPLSTIRLNMELLAEEFDEDPTPRERRALKRIELVDRECARLQKMLDDYLSFTRVRGLELKPGNLNEVVEGVLEFFAPQASEHEIEIIRYLNPDLPHVMLNDQSMHQAILNLVLNAQQAMPAGGQLVVRSQAGDNLVALQLIDTGSGIDEKTGAKIFEPFFSTKSGGTGLGLPTTSKIVEAHGGRISIQSELGLGTQFTIELPVAARLTGGRDEHSAAEASDTPGPFPS